jgi:hypothetical protein
MSFTTQERCVILIGYRQLPKRAILGRVLRGNLFEAGALNSGYYLVMKWRGDGLRHL